MDQRSHPRYRLSRTVNVGIACGPHAFTGKLVDFSKGGLQVTLHADDPRTIHAPELEWNFAMEEVSGRGNGEAVRIQPLLSGNTRLGMRVPATEITIEGKSFQEIITLLANDDSAGAIRMAPNWRDQSKPVIEVIGKLHARLVRDFTRLVADGCATVDLSRCRDIDSGGIGLLAIAHEHGIAFTGAAGRVKQLIANVDRFQSKHLPYRNAAQSTRWSPASAPTFRH